MLGPAGRANPSPELYVRVSATGITSGRDRSVLCITKMPVDGSTGSARVGALGVWPPGGVGSLWSIEHRARERVGASSHPACVAVCPAGPLNVQRPSCPGVVVVTVTVGPSIVIVPVTSEALSSFTATLPVLAPASMPIV